ncbi:HEAT repeat domain-containing protein [Actinocorallia libanotica]|uniref:HEAT repeat protein n=1 Tax=Actinocorallia libanotica TaxID=46162 RepID=A0ABN1RCX8_9ACTN
MRDGSGREPDPDAIFTYNEPDIPPGRDGLPPGDAGRVPDSSRAVLRMRVEELLGARETPGAEAWRPLGRDARRLLVELLDDSAVTGHEAMLQRVMATTAQLGIDEAVPRLGRLLLDRSQSPLTRTFAASAVGRLAPDAALEPLAAAVGDADPMVRRQVARALAAATGPAARAHLERLLDDPAPSVAEAAAEALAAPGRGTGLEPGRGRARDLRPPEELPD